MKSAAVVTVATFSMCLLVFAVVVAKRWITPAATLSRPTIVQFPPIPGNPQTAVTSFQHLYRAMVAFRGTHGRLPNGMELHDLNKPIAAGIRLTADDLTNRDARTPEYAASLPKGFDPEPQYAVLYRGRRPNGDKKPAFPRRGERDLWFESRHYMRRFVVGKGPNSNVKYFGVMVGLFSDGKIEVRPMDQMVARRLGPNALKIEFPDQTGMPKDTLPAEEMWQRLGDVPADAPTGQ